MTKQISTFHIANVHNKINLVGEKKQCTNSKDKYIIYMDILQNPL